ncbi:MAG: hypothetical protein F6K10_34415 [Moorea sp. SIO2B7]|nr:hypothetical protein [Moorena sp. SIO2B7]
MKFYYPLAASLIFLLSGSQPLDFQLMNKAAISGNITITLKRGVWKLWEEKPVYQDITLDLVCKQGRCEQEVWAHAPKFNQADHDGKVEVLNSEQAWRLQVKINIRPDPWQSLEGEANYQIELIPQENRLIGTYSGSFNDEPVYGKVSGNITPHWPKKISNHLPISPREHPRLIFRQHEVPVLREKAKTDYGQTILAQLKIALDSKIYYDGYSPNGGYHAAGHCFLSLLNNDQQAAETAWQIVENSMNNPGPRLLEQSPIVAGIALAYDLCYHSWDEKRLTKTTSWLATESKILIEGTPDRGWNPNSWSNWSARARGAAGLATLATISEPQQFFSEPINSWRLLKIAERNIKRYLTIGIGDRGFGTEGDHYTIEPLVLTIIPFLQAYENVLGKDLVSDSSAQWFLPHYVMRMVGSKGKLSLPAYGRHRSGPGGSLFALGWHTVPERFLPGVLWFFQRHFGWQGDKSFGIGVYGPYEAAFALRGYRNDVVPKNPAEIFGRVLVDQQKGLYAFRNQWQDSNDFVASIYLKRQPLKGSWSFPDAGSFRIWGLGGKWAKAGPSKAETKNENVVVVGNQGAWKDARGAKPTFFKSYPDGSGVVSLRRYNWLRSFAVDYSGASGAPGLFVVVDKFTTENSQSQDKTWVMHTEGKVTIEGQSFTIKSISGATMQGTFVTPNKVKISFEGGENGGVIRATGGNPFFVVMTVQKGLAPEVQISGSGLNAQVKVGGQSISFGDDKIVLVNSTDT